MHMGCAKSKTQNCWHREAEPVLTMHVSMHLLQSRMQILYRLVRVYQLSLQRINELFQLCQARPSV